MKAIVLGANHYNTLWVARSLNLADYEVTVIVWDDSKKSFISKSKHVSHFYLFSTSEEVLHCLMHNIVQNEKAPLFTTGDVYASFVDENYNELRQKYILQNCENRAGGILKWMDKRLMLEKAEKDGFIIPRTTTVDLSTVDNIDFTQSSITYPCIVKPQISSKGSKLMFRICNDESSLEKSIEELKEECKQLIIQQYIKPDFEIAILGMRSRVADKIVIPGLITKVSTCSSTYNLGMTAYAYIDKKFKPLVDLEIVSSFLKNIDYNGLFSIEYFVKNNKAYFLEINFRTDGNLFMCTTAGVNLPHIWTSYETGKKDVAYPHTIKRKYAMIEISYIKYSNWLKPIQRLKEWWKTDCYSIFSWSDIKPFIYKFIYAI